MRVSPCLLKFAIHFIGSGAQPSRVFDLTPIFYLEYWGPLSLCLGPVNFTLPGPMDFQSKMFQALYSLIIALIFY